MSANLEETVNRLDKAVFGDRDNIKETPGIISDQARMSLEQARTNEILMELRDSLLRINWMIVAGFVTALGSIVYKGLH